MGMYGLRAIFQSRARQTPRPSWIPRIVCLIRYYRNKPQRYEPIWRWSESSAEDAPRHSVWLFLMRGKFPGS
jgi:hypothetical protein